MKKGFLQALYIAIPTVLLCYLGAPWWVMLPVAALLVFFFPAESAAATFAAGFASGSLLWYGLAIFQDMLNGSQFSAKIGEIFMGLKNWQLLSITATLGGLLAGMGALCGHYLRLLLVSPKPKRYANKKYY